MKKFDNLLKQCYNTLLEADMKGNIPPQEGSPDALPSDGNVPPNTGSALPGMTNPGADGGMGGGMGGSPDGMGGGEATSAPLDAKTKRETDPQEYTRSILAMLVDKQEGITPEMFDDYINSTTLAATKIKDKEGIKRFYGNFYNKLQTIVDLSEEVKKMYRQLSGVTSDLTSTNEDPNNASGGVGQAGPNGPGVK